MPWPFEIINKAFVTKTQIYQPASIPWLSKRAESEIEGESPTTLAEETHLLKFRFVGFFSYNIA